MLSITEVKDKMEALDFSFPENPKLSREEDPSNLFKDPEMELYALNLKNSSGDLTLNPTKVWGRAPNDDIIEVLI